VGGPHRSVPVQARLDAPRASCGNFTRERPAIHLYPARHTAHIPLGPRAGSWMRVQATSHMFFITALAAPQLDGHSASRTTSGGAHNTAPAGFHARRQTPRQRVIRPVAAGNQVASAAAKQRQTVVILHRGAAIIGIETFACSHQRARFSAFCAPRPRHAAQSRADNDRSWAKGPMRSKRRE